MAVGIRKYGIQAVLCVLLLAPGIHSVYASNSSQEPDPLPENGPIDKLYDMDGNPISDSSTYHPVFDIESGEPAILFRSDSTLIYNESIAPSDSTEVRADSTGRKRKGSFLDELLSGTSADSLDYFPRIKKVYSYQNSDVKYTDKNLIADFMEMDMETKIIYARGIPSDTTEAYTRPIFMDGDHEYTMDTITYNIGSEIAMIKGINTQEGEGILSGGIVKKLPDNTVNVAHGRYSVCDHEHPHFYITMTKAKMIPKQKAVFGPSYLVIEDVPIYFLALPFGFFPLNNERSSGFIMPTFGESTMKGFYLREGGYYFAPNQYVDLTLLGGIYTLGSWETSLSSRYVKRYKYRGNLGINYSKEVFGDRGSADFGNMTNFRVMWTHSQDPKFSPNSTFAASVNFSSSGYNKYSSNNINDYVNSQTNSSISYSRNWPGKPYSFSTNMSHSQNSRDSTISLTLPSFSFNVSRINPFKRRNALGREKWYEKIAFTYSGTFSNSVTSKQDELFSENTFKKMRNGMNHNIPVTTSLSLFNYINIEPRMSYQERWYFSKIGKAWNPDKNMVEVTDTTYGFYRVYNYSFGVSASTRVYGTFEFKEKSAVKAIRHVITPTVGLSYTPDFGQSKFGYHIPIQTDSTGRVGYYSPYEQGMYGVPGRGKSASLTFSLANTLEMKVRSKTEPTGEKKLKILDNLSASGSYNFLADSMNLSTIPVSLRSSIIPGFGINLNMVFDPYQVASDGRRINKFMIEDGKLARLVSVSQSFGYSFSGGGAQSNPNAVNAGDNALTGGVYDPTLEGEQQPIIDPTERRLRMTGLYYDFSIPYNVSINYGINYNNNGIKKTVTQTLGFSSSVTITPKWGLTFSGGYDFQAKKLTPGQFVLTRDLHCWQMNFTWIPIGFMQSWSFNISVKSGVLRDLKYDKRSSFYDNFYDI